MTSPKQQPPTTSRSPESDWSSVRALTSRLLQDSDKLADELLRQQYQSVPGLDASLAPDDSREHARWLVRAFLEGISERRSPTAEQIARCKAFGARRAGHGIAADAIRQGYHDAHRGLWQRVIEEIVTSPGVGPAMLAATFVHGLQWLHEAVEAMGLGFQSQETEIRSARQRATNQLVNLLESAETGSDRVRSLTTALGFDPDGRFTAVHGHPRPELTDCRDNALLPSTRLIQDGTVTTALGSVAAGERWGIGAARPGLLGARRSILDAKLAFAALGDQGGRLDFAESWCMCLPHAHREAIDPLMHTARQVADSRPYLLDAVVAFADARFTVSAAARALIIHPNTLGYRLDQWSKLTGLDPRTVSGLAQSLYLAR